MKTELGPGGQFMPSSGFEKNPNHNPPPGNEVAKKVGRLAEKGVMSAWTKNLEAKPLETAEKLYQELVGRLKGIFYTTLTGQRYQEVMRGVLEGEASQVYEEVKRLTRINFNFSTDDSKEIGLGEIYKIMGAIAVLRQTANPDVAFANTDGRLAVKAGQRFGGVLIPDVRGAYGQFDAIMVPGKAQVDDSKGVIEHIRSGGAWMSWEAKLPLRPRYLSGGRGGGGKIRKVFSWDLRQHYDRLGYFLIENPGVSLPVATGIIYLRGILPSVVHVWPFTPEEYWRWYDRLEAGIADQRNNGNNPELLEKTKEALYNYLMAKPKSATTELGSIEGTTIPLFDNE